MSRSSRITFPLYCIVAWVLCGCSTPRENFPRIINEPAPLTAAVRARFGTLGILPTGAANDLRFDAPAGKVEAIQSIRESMFKRSWEAGRPDGQEEYSIDRQTGEPITRYPRIEDEAQQGVAAFVLSLITADVTGLVGGVLLGVGEDDIRSGQQALKRAVSDRIAEKRFEARLSELASASRSVRMLQQSEGLAFTNAAGFTPEERVHLSRAGIDSVLVTRVSEQRFMNVSGINPPMTFAATLLVRVIRVSDGAVLHAGYLDYRGTRHTFTEWTSDNAARLRQELTQSAETLANGLRDQLFPN